MVIVWDINRSNIMLNQLSIQSILRLKNRDKTNSKGFTLVEVLTGASIGLFAVGVAGSGLVSATKTDGLESERTQRRVELNRALEYISDEIRMANQVTPASAYTITDSSTSAIPLFELTFPNSSNKVVYYLQKIGTSGPWLKDYVIKRTEVAPETTTISDARGQELVDGIAESDAVPIPSCSGGTLVPNPSGTVGAGFQACIQGDGRLAELYLYGKLNHSTNPYLEVSTKVFARSGAMIASGIGDISTSGVSESDTNINDSFRSSDPSNNTDGDSVTTDDTANGGSDEKDTDKRVSVKSCLEKRQESRSYGIKAKTPQSIMSARCRERLAR